MPLVVKRKLSQSWREAVAKRAQEFEAEEEWLRIFDAHLDDGKHEAEAAYMTLAQFDALYPVPDGLEPGRRSEL